MRERRLLSVSHSYVVAMNRRFAVELSREGAGSWSVTAAAPSRFRGDLREIELERIAGEPLPLRALAAYGTRSQHLFCYGLSLASTLRAGWDCVHVWEEPFVVAGAQIAAWTPRGVPLSFTTFQNIRKKYPPPFAQFERRVVERAAGWIAGSHTVARALGNSPGYRARPFATIPLGVDVDAFKPDGALRTEALRRLAWEDNGPPVVGFLGRLVPEKGISFLMSSLDGTRAPWRALVVGGGPLDGAVREWAARQGSRVRFVPPIVHDEVPMYLNAMDVLCAPSETLPGWQEQLGRMIIEAFACGVAVVGSDSGEIPFTIGDAGVVARERDTGEWIAALTGLLEAPERRRALAAAGRERAGSHFAWRVVARQTLAFLGQLADVR